MVSSSRVCLATVALIASAGLLAAVGCKGDFERLETILQRQSAALAPLPEEDRGWKTHYEQEAYLDRTDVLGSPGELSIEQARAIALRGNPDIHAVRARLEQCLARIGEARAPYFPNITLGHSSSRTFQTPAQQSGVSISPWLQTLPNIPTNFQTLDLNTLVQFLATPLLQSSGYGYGGGPGAFSEHTTTISASWTLFDGFSREATLLAAKHGHSAAKMALSDAQRLLSRAVDGAYYQAQLAREQVRIARADVAFSGRQLDAVQQRMAAGKATKGDVLNFDLRLRAAQADEVAAVGLLENSRTVLAELMGIDDARLPAETTLCDLAPETAEELSPPNADELVERALVSRPDLAQKEFQLQAKTEEVRAAEGQFSPSVLLSGSYGFDRISNIAYEDGDQASAGAIEVRWQLFTGGLRTSRVRFLRGERWEVAAQLRRLRQQVASEVRQAVTDVVNAQEQVRLQGVNLETAHEHRRIIEAEYEGGKASLVRLNEAQRDLVETEARLASARIRLRRSWADLRAAVSNHAVSP